MAMSSLNISLPQPLKKYVDERVKRDGYSTPSEFVRELLRSDQKRRVEEKLEFLLAEGVDSGEPVEADEAFWDGIRRDVVRLSRQRRLKKTK